MRFTSQRDFDTVIKINKELVNNVIDIQVRVFKINQEVTQVNSYNEAIRKTYFSGVFIPCLFQREESNTTSDMMTVNAEQTAKFSFLRQECQERGIYPESGDIIEYSDSYYEIDNTNEIQLFAGREEYNLSIVCEAHLTRNSAVQLDKPVL
jgi:hypothetical protein